MRRTLGQGGYRPPIVTTADFIGLQPTDDPLTWRLPITKLMTTARGALYGGSGLAAVIAALEESTDRPLVWATAQYLSFVRMPATLDVRLHLPVVGARTTQARGTVWHADDEILSVLATLGHRDEHAHWTYAEPPEVPRPDETRRQVVAEAEGTIHDVLDMRIVRGVSRRQLLRGKPHVESGGRAAYWVRLPGGRHVPDAAELALVGDLVPSAFPQATGEPISGSSLDNTIRTGELVATEWVLADVQVHAVVDGYGHGIAHLWSEDGTLLGTASQSAFVRRPER